MISGVDRAGHGRGPDTSIVASRTRPWLDAELRLVRPTVVATLGATAAKALLGSKFRITESRGTVLEWEGFALVATVHPSAILRLDPAEPHAAFDALVADLKVVAAQHS